MLTRLNRTTYYGFYLRFWVWVTIRVLHPGTAEFQATDPRRRRRSCKGRFGSEVPEPYSVWPIAGYNSRAATNPL